MSDLRRSSEMVKAGERFSTLVQLTAKRVSSFAKAAGDTNPIHHDADYAKTTHFKRPIASGTHTGALLMGAAASHFSQQGAMLGLEFSFKFKRPVYADEKVDVEWLVVRVTDSERLNGQLVDLRGRLKKENGKTAVGAIGRVLLTDKL